MAASSNNDDDDGLITAINVTPLVDVVLVLLIIFMVTARIIHAQGMPMDLPKAASAESIQTTFSIELGADGSVMVDSERIANDDAISPLAVAARSKNPDIRTVIRADKKVEHGRVIHVIDLLRRAGISKFALAATQAEVKTDAPPPVDPQKK